MKKIIALTAILFALSGCRAETTTETHNYVLPDGMKDCKIYQMSGEGTSKTLYVVRCPNSQTNTLWSEYNYATKTHQTHQTYTNSNDYL